MKISTRLRTSLYWATIVAHIPWTSQFFFAHPSDFDIPMTELSKYER